jgi:UDP-N-acetylmuramoyl-tripeptide--D-alanyl-D-alanine ligase
VSALWTETEAAVATGGSARGNWSARGISIDTRTLEAGDLFIALKGDARDGHEFVRGALEKGAAAALVSRIPAGLPETAPLLVAGDTQNALEGLGTAARTRTRARIVAITGSAGKTTTKEMLRLMLSGEGSVSASAASYNNHWGVPLSLARMARDTNFGVFEIGMNHEGEIRALVKQVRPHAAIITTVAAAHLEYFGKVEKIADAKAEIFEGLDADGVAILPLDNPQFNRLKLHALNAGVKKLLTFGRTEGADARLVDSETRGDAQIVTADIKGEILTFTIGAPGVHIASNALAALLTVDVLGADIHQAAEALSGFSALKGRGARSAAGGIEIIDESYNANPASMRAALGLLGQAAPGGGGRRIAILGDMLELGPEGAALHRAIAEDIAANGAELVFLCGAQMCSLWDVLPEPVRGAYAEKSTELAPDVLARVRPGDVVLVKGSFGSRMSVIIDALKARAAAGTV